MDQNKVVISGYYGCGNLGDEAILSVLLGRLRARWPQLKMTVLSGAPQETSRVHRVHAINRWNFFSIARELRSADLLISGGGGLLQDRTSRRSALYYLGIIGLAQALGRPVFVIGQGLGPLKRRWLQRLARQRLQGVSYALVRDERSFQLLKGWGITEGRLARGGDLALIWPSGGAEHAVPLPVDERQKPYLVAALKGPQPPRTVQMIAHALDELADEQDLNIVLLALCAQSDREMSQAIAQQMRQRSLIVAPDAGQLREALALIAGARFVLGMRLHALIFALRTATPFAALSDDPKIDHFVATIERSSGLRLPLWPIADLGHSELDLRSAFAELAREREGNEMHEALRRGVAQLAAEAEAALQNCLDEMEPLLHS